MFGLKVVIKKNIKNILRPFAGPIFHVLHFKIFGKNIFMNRYVRKISVVDSLFNAMEWRTILVGTDNIRKKEYSRWFKRNYPTAKELRFQTKESAKFSKKPLISVLIPTYNTDLTYLVECIESVLSQSYGNWELCIADDKSSDKGVLEIIEDYAKEDKRIKIVARRENGHICKATNSALKIATGEYVALLDHDDRLWPNALFEVVKTINNHPDTDFLYSDEDKIDEQGENNQEPFFKPGWSPEFLRSINYITHFAVLRRSIVDKVGGFRVGYEGAQDWDLFLRVSRETNNIRHISKVLYSWRKSENSTAKQPSAKDYAYVNQKKALLSDIKSRGLQADIEWEIPLSMWRVQYKIIDNPKVSIIIPTKDSYAYISRCLKTIEEKTIYSNVEIIIVDTGSTDNKVWDLYDKYSQIWNNLHVLKWDKKFNFSAVCNFGAVKATGEYFLFLNNDTEVITTGWVKDMLAYSQQKDVGAVGCKLLYPDGRLQHGGVILGVGGQDGTPGIAGHYFPAFMDHPPQDHAQQLFVGGTRNFAAVTAACVMVSAKNFKKVKGFDDKFRIAFNDVDLCLKLHAEKLRNVYLPHVKLYHHESVSVGKPGSNVRDPEEFKKEIDMMLKKWKNIIDNDPYYHSEFRRDIASARIKIER